jgi:hypothetical protein
MQRCTELLRSFTTIPQLSWQGDLSSRCNAWQQFHKMEIYLNSQPVATNGYGTKITKQGRKCKTGEVFPFSCHH